MAHRSSTINVMINAARKAGRGLIRDFNEVEHLQVSLKGPADFVSNADLKAEKTLIEELHKSRPDYGFLVEERGLIKGKSDEFRWIIDPLDGTLNYLHSIPHFAISIGLEREGKIIAAGIYDPVKDEFFWAEKGKGAYLDDRRLRVSARKKMLESVFATGIPCANRATGHGHHLKEQAELMPQVAGIRRFGSAALDLAYVAAGRYEGFWERGLEKWDIAAGLLLVREAGGLVTDFESSNTMLETGDIVAASAEIHTPFIRALRNVGPLT
ncbi:MAG: inositol monophosphatase family protein [Alphaproteobacteria bacterium]